MQKDAFKPQGREISVMGMGNPLATQGGAMPTRMMPSVGPAAPARSAAAGGMSMETVGRGAAIGGAKPVPRGAQAVRLAGSTPPPLDGGAVDRGASFQPVGTPPGAEAPPPAPSMGQAPRPFLQRTPAPGGESVFRITTRLRLGDGGEALAVYDAVAEPGAQVIDISYMPIT